MKIGISDPHRNHWQTDVFTYSGDPIIKDISNVNDEDSIFQDVYNIVVRETVDLQKDPKSQCLDYPLSTYKNYKTCVDLQINNKFRAILNCIPPWFRLNDNDTLCTGKQDPKHGEEVNTLIWKFLDMTLFQVREAIFLNV